MQLNNNEDGKCLIVGCLTIIGLGVLLLSSFYMGPTHFNITAPTIKNGVFPKSVSATGKGSSHTYTIVLSENDGLSILVKPPVTIEESIALILFDMPLVSLTKAQKAMVNSQKEWFTK